MTLIDKETIRAEIERIRSEAVMASFGNETYWLRSRVATCVDILAFLDTLPEQPASEDERIRNAIESIIRVYGKTQGEWIAGYDMDTLVVHLRNAFASLEKQKESLHISESCKENADSFTDERQPGEGLDKARFLEVLDKWEEHAIRGMRNGATAYHQGKIALIEDLRDWINGED